MNHGKEEYVRGDVYTNSVENFYSVFKRGTKGAYQHCSEKHLHRYVAEFDFRFSNRVALGTNDMERAEKLAKGIVGKRGLLKSGELKQKARAFVRWRKRK